MARPRLLLPALLLLFVACEPPGPSQAELDAAKKAAEKKAADEEAMARRKAEREAKEKAEKDAEAQLAAQIDALAVLPDPLPKKLDKVCAERAAAEDEFMNKHYEGEALAKWNTAKGTQLGFAKQGCIKAGKIEIAACQINAMRNAPAELKKNLPDLLKRCIDKFGGGDPAGAG
jgi:hypothetical protein